MDQRGNHLGSRIALRRTSLRGSVTVSSSAASSLTRIEPRAQTTTARASLSLREHAAYEDTLTSLYSFVSAREVRLDRLR